MKEENKGRASHARRGNVKGKDEGQGVKGNGQGTRRRAMDKVRDKGEKQDE